MIRLCLAPKLRVGDFNDLPILEERGRVELRKESASRGPGELEKVDWLARLLPTLVIKRRRRGGHEGIP